MGILLFLIVWKVRRALEFFGSGSNLYPLIYLFGLCFQDFISGNTEVDFNQFVDSSYELVKLLFEKKSKREKLAEDESLDNKADREGDQVKTETDDGLKQNATSEGQHFLENYCNDHVVLNFQLFKASGNFT